MQLQCNCKASKDGKNRKKVEAVEKRGKRWKQWKKWEKGGSSGKKRRKLTSRDAFGYARHLKKFHELKNGLDSNF